MRRCLCCGCEFDASTCPKCGEASFLDIAPPPKPAPSSTVKESQKPRPARKRAAATKKRAARRNQ